ncbi:MlaA family lipoprotein [Glaciecola petra]|uniref:VacJ family lipoprotein n=1 Tax=Glaciecola petra TaxID=3075602 RepID=A0ABU2ZMR6_9ALTE|nr:VacJ family lipoprotein [Aestuariibacter sp. P117]MDT0593649.1 VacJ family lipoprotein [Aestuariibacter sp. P117]
MKASKQSLAILIMLSALIGGCASNQNTEAQLQAQTNSQTNKNAQNSIEEPILEAEDENKVSDPLEPINRVVWDFNYDVLDRFLIKPITEAYIEVTPTSVRNGLVNASNNIEEPANTINNLLQGKFQASLTSVGRFAINSTAGVLGIFDVAGDMGLERERENFGEVLGVWGVGTGPYLMLPALGPSDFRSLTGRVVDNYYWPSTVLRDPYVVGAAVVSILEARASLLEQEETLNRALDQYLFVRDAYFQRLAFEVSDGKIEQKTEEELEAEEDDFSDFESLLEGIQ